MYSIACNTEDCNKENDLKKPTYICIHTHTHTRQRNKRSSCQYPLNHRKSKVIPEKISTSASLTMLKPLTAANNKLWKILKRWEYQTMLPAS